MFQELGSMRHGCCTLVWIMGTEMFLAKNLTTHDIFLSDKYGHQGGLKSDGRDTHKHFKELGTF